MKNVISKNACIVLLIQTGEKIVNNKFPAQHGSPLLQHEERRSIALWKDGDVKTSERHLASFPIIRNPEFFIKDFKEKNSLKIAKKEWKQELEPGYKPKLLLRA